MRCDNKQNNRIVSVRSVFIRSVAVVICAAPFLLLSLEAFARAGGGGNDSSMNALLYIILWPFMVIYGAYVSLRVFLKRLRVSSALAEMARVEPQWSEEKLLSFAKERFELLQSLWGKNDLENIKKYLTPELYPSWEVQLSAKIKANEQNIMAGVSVNYYKIVDAKNYRDNDRDEFTVLFKVSANDQIFRNNVMVSSKSKPFKEFWTFRWQQGAWLLAEITQEEGWGKFINSATIFERGKGGGVFGS